MKKHLIVVGGGAAGFFCAVNAARLNPSLRVTLLEKSNKLLSKVKISGGGRCNVTHACFEIADMMKKYPRGTHFLKKTFHQFFTTDTIRWFEERGVSLKTEPDGRMFPVTDTSQTIIDCLMREVNINHVQILMNAEVKAFKQEDGRFRVGLSDLRLLDSDYICIACGGYHKSLMFEWIRVSGHTIEEPVPSLFTFNIPNHPLTRLMGISVADAQVKICGSKLSERGPILITHWGLSGPAVLRLSAWGARELAVSGWQFAIAINWLPGLSEINLKEKFQELRIETASQKIINKNAFDLPQRLWQFLCQQTGIAENMRWGDLPSGIQNLLIRNLLHYELQVNGKTTFKEEFVTAGGIHLNEIDANTMQSKIVPGLFFAGEIMNVDGITGGFNFQHAWTTGWIAANAIAQSI
ncbi:MAG: NAD(P)/FAD-dependent oxidoreductase [Chitinophagaceae bacterium]|nr:NAD(P)/FAD-dependent oxidoreductase [Chitinophagaceae bacterium]